MINPHTNAKRVKFTFSSNKYPRNQIQIDDKRVLPESLIIGIESDVV